MKNNVTLHCIAILIVVLVPAVLQAQTRQSSNPDAVNTNPAPAPLILVSGRVRVDDGSAVPGSITIQSICKGYRHTEAHTDSKGNFNFELGNQSNVMEDISNDAGASRPGRPSADPDAPPRMKGQVLGSRNWQECQLQALVPGFSSRTIQMPNFGDWGSVDAGTILLHRTGLSTGLTVSVTTAAAPKGAKKAFQKGQDHERDGKWDEAQKSFEKAVQSYPQFAEAWVELARVQRHGKDVASAKKSLKQAIAADPQLVTPFCELARIAFDEGDWQEVIDEADRGLKLNSQDFPDVWFLQAASYYYIKKYTAAEQSAREGLKVDSEHQIPKLEYLLGVVLVNLRQYPEAIQHMRNYVRLAPNAPDLAKVNEQIAQLEKLPPAQTAKQQK